VDVEQFVPTDAAHDHLCDYHHIDADGERDNPLSESNAHWWWNNLIGNAASDAFKGKPVTVTGNLVLREGPEEVRVAPDVMVVPVVLPEHQRSYRPGLDGPPPMACVEVLSRSNKPGDIERRGKRMMDLGCDEVYVVDVEKPAVTQLVLDAAGDAVHVDVMGKFLPGLGIIFARTHTDDRLAVCCPGGRLATPDLNPWSELRTETQRADEQTMRADTEAQRADTEAQRADTAEARAMALAAKLRELGIDPDAVT
jgi:hypothetical protein